jgi:uroporphyrinogen-III synthase
MDSSLKNITLWVTRPAGQAKNLTRQLEEHGAKVFHLPLMQIEVLPQDKALEKKIKKLKDYDMAFFVSTNAAQIAMGLIETFFPTLPDDIEYFSPGITTARVLQSYGLKVSYPEKAMSTEALLVLPAIRKVIQKDSKKKKRAVIFRGMGGRELLANALRSKGVNVDYIELYKRVLPDYKESYLKEIIKNKKPDGIIFSSAEAIHNFIVLYEKIYPEFKEIPVFVSSPRLENIVNKIGFETVTLLKAADDESIVSGVVNSND